MKVPMKLYSYWRSSAAYRVRIALAIKQIPYEYLSVSLIAHGGEHRATPFATKNPQKLVPLLELEDGRYITQSLAIIEYLDEVAPTPRLLPDDPYTRAQARAIALAVACEIHPLNNLRVLRYLEDSCHLAEPERTSWYRHWITEGFGAIEQMIGRHEGPFALGDTVSIADLSLVPQVYNAHRFNIPLDSFPRIREVYEACISLPAFQAAAPELQPDAPKTSA